MKKTSNGLSVRILEKEYQIACAEEECDDLIKAARYLGRGELIPAIRKAARRMAAFYTVEAWEDEVDSDKTKGAYQWSSMAFTEYSGAGFPDAKLYEDVTLVLGWWMIHTHRTLRRTRNTAYAHEGLASAFAVAKERGDELVCGVG